MEEVYSLQWLNEPPKWTEGERILSLEAAPGTDFWRKTHDNAVRDNGHFWCRRVSGDFMADVEVSGEYGALYDQAGLMVRLGETTWLKCGVEYVDGVKYASVVVTRDFSDWSITEVAGEPESIHFRVKREGGTFEVSYSLDGADYSMLRVAHLTDVETLAVGPMAAAPKGDGFSATFRGFEIRGA